MKKGDRPIKELWIEMKGRYISCYNSPKRERKIDEIMLEKGTWQVSEQEKQKQDGKEKEEGKEGKEREKEIFILLVKKGGQERIEFYFMNEKERKGMLERMIKIVESPRTHGIDVSRQKIEPHVHPLLQEKIPSESFLDLSVWDFAGQHEYYNNHQYFLSDRTIFMIPWKMSEGEKGMEGLKYWFRSLSSHLPRYNPDNKEITLSMIIVGTHLDDIQVKKEKKDEEERKEKILRLSKECGLTYPLEIIEVSTKTMENISSLQEKIYSSALSHSYMGERIPSSYLAVEQAVLQLREIHQEMPILTVDELHEHLKKISILEFNFELIQRALLLLSSWGVCVYSEKPIELSKYVVVEPRFLTKKVMSQLFSIVDKNLVLKRANGIISHQDLPSFWPGISKEKLPIVLQMMEKFEVCFQIKDKNDLQQQEKEEKEKKEEKEFFSRKSIIPSLLPEEIPQDIWRYWSADVPFGQIQVERVIKFNIVPQEMVGRLFVRIHESIQNGMVWRHGVLIIKQNTSSSSFSQARIEVDVSRDLFNVKVRGKDRKECIEMMEYILSQVESSSSKYGGVEWKQCVRSPHHYHSLIDLDDLKSAIEEKKEKMRCPTTYLPIKTKLLTVSGGLDDEGPSEMRKDVVIEEDQVKNEKEFEKLKFLFSFFGGDPQTIKKAYSIHNPTLMTSFTSYRDIITQKHKDSPSLFKKTSWDSEKDVKKRISFLQHLSDQAFSLQEEMKNDGDKVVVSFFLFSFLFFLFFFFSFFFFLFFFFLFDVFMTTNEIKTKTEKTFVVPMLQGTIEDAAWKISENGFGTVATRDEGYYGKGFLLFFSFQNKTTKKNK